MRSQAPNAESAQADTCCQFRHGRSQRSDNEANDVGDSPFYVMPWADRTLRNAKHLRYQVAPVLEMGIALADALAAAHKQGVIHRDVKPENVLLFGDELTPTIADFGICFLADDERITQTLADTIGSADYAAPELRGGRLEDVDARVDVYSLGKTLYSALAGGPPFPLEWHDDPRYDLRKSDDSEAMRHFYGLLPHLVASERDQRFSTMEAARAELQRALRAVRSFEAYRDGMY